MKRYIKSNLSYSEEFDLGIDIYFWDMLESAAIAATKILPVGIDKENNIIDEEAKEGFTAFVTNLFEIIEAYDFKILDDYKHTSKSFPRTSEYRWIARNDEIENKNVPQFIKLRVAEHIQKFSPERQQELKKQYQAEANVIKLPKTKKKQRYIFKDIAVNDLGCETYEEALHIIEMKIRDWLESKGIDLEPYGPAIW